MHLSRNRSQMRDEGCNQGHSDQVLHIYERPRSPPRIPGLRYRPAHRKSPNGLYRHWNEHQRCRLLPRPVSSGRCAKSHWQEWADGKFHSVTDADGRRTPRSENLIESGCSPRSRSRGNARRGTTAGGRPCGERRRVMVRFDRGLSGLVFGINLTI